MRQYIILGNIWPVIPLRVNKFLKKHQGCVWYHYGILLHEHSLIRPLRFKTIRHNKIKYYNMIEENQWKALKKEVSKKALENLDVK